MLHLTHSKHFMTMSDPRVTSIKQALEGLPVEIIEQETGGLLYVVVLIDVGGKNTSSESSNNKQPSGEPTPTSSAHAQAPNANAQTNTNVLSLDHEHEPYLLTQLPDALRHQYPPTAFHSQQQDATTPIQDERSPFPSPEDFDHLQQQYAPHTHRPLSHCLGCGALLFALPIHADRAACFKCLQHG